MSDRISINDLTSEQLDQLYDERDRYFHFACAARGASGARTFPDLTDAILALVDRAEQAEAWRRKAIRRALETSKLRGAIEGCRDLISEDITRSDAWGDGYREAINDLREILAAFGQLEPDHDGPSVAEATADDRRWWNGEKEGE